MNEVKRMPFYKTKTFIIVCLIIISISLLLTIIYSQKTKKLEEKIKGDDKYAFIVDESEITDAEKQFALQATAIIRIQQGLRTFYAVNKYYPNSLEELLKTIGKNGDNYIDLEKIPIDLYTNNPLQYKLSEEAGYILTYIMNLPSENTTGTKTGENINVFRDTFIEGINRATKDCMSCEEFIVREGADALPYDLDELD